MFDQQKINNLFPDKSLYLDKREYSNTSNGFYIQYIAYKNGILLANVQGVSNESDVVNYLKIRDELVLAAGYSDYVEIRQNHENASTTQGGRKEIIRYYTKVSSHCRALIYTNVSLIVSLQIKAGKLLIKNKNLIVTTAKNLDEGIKFGLNLLQRNAKEFYIPMVSNEDWNACTPQGKLSYYFIAPDIVYADCEGSFFISDYEIVQKAKNKIYLDNNLFGQPIYKIFDFSKVKYSEMRFKKMIFKDNVLEEEKGLMRGICLINSDIMIKFFLNISKALFKKKTSHILVNSLHEAIKIINDLRSGIYAVVDRVISIKESEFKKILGMIQSINWDLEEENFTLAKSDIPDVQEVLEMLFIMRSDIKEYVKQLNAKYGQLEEESAMRRNAEMVLSEKNMELTEAQNHILSIFNTIKDGLSIIDRDGYLQDCNDAYLKMFGIDRNKMHTVNVFRSYPKEEAAKLKNYFASLMNNKKSVCRLKKYNSERNLIDIAITSSIMAIKQSSDYFIVSVVSDITDEILNEFKLEERNKQLENALFELKQSQDILVKQEKLASLGTMVAGIAHEINNPAQAIKFSLESLKLNVTDLKQLADEVLTISELPEQERIIHLADLKNVINFLNLPEIIKELDQVIEINKNSIDRIENIVMSTKRMSYADANFTDCNINEVLTDALTLINNQVKYQVQIERNFQDNLPLIYGLTQELGQVFMNFIINARDAIVDKGLDYKNGCIKITTRYLENEHNIEIVFADNGSGIKGEIFKKIFDPFFTTKPLGKGTGLGLNIAHRIIESHGGDIHVESQIGSGTTFKIILPVRNRRINEVT